jgi:hypothetical protein
VSGTSSQQDADSGEPPAQQTEQARQERRRRLDEVFGEVLPSQTSDDRDAPSGEGEAGHEEWLRRQVPPHHG